MNEYDDNDEYEVEEDTKKSTGKTITIVILLLMLIASLSYIGYFDIYIPYYEKPNKVNIEDEKDEEREMYASEVVKIEDKLNDYLYFAYDFDKDASEIDNQKLLSFALHKIGKFKEEIPKEEIEDIVEKYFGSNVKLNHEDIICTVENIALYNFKDDKYILNESHPGHGGLSYTGGSVHIISGDVDLKNKEYIIKGRILYTLEGLTGMSENAMFYKSVDDIESNNPIINNDLKPKTYDDVSSFLPVTTFKFTKKGDNYYLKSIKIGE